jgi:hypothetical protein
MRSKIVIVVMLFLIALMPGAMPSAQAVPRGTAGETGQSSQTNIVETYAKLPLLFVHNQGQLDSQVEYYVKTPRQTVYLTPSGMVFDLIRYQNTGTADSADRKAERFAFSLDFVGGNASPLIQGVTQDKAVVNYFIGNDPDKWHTDIATYREVLYKDVYPGIDLRLYGKENALEYEFVVQPGADVSDIALAYSGVDGLNLESNGLVVSTVFGELKQSQPCIYQQIGDDTVAVAGGFSLLGADSYGFEVGAYDAGYPLIIDPSLALAYSTYLGGSDEDRGFGIAVESGCAYVTGETVSADFPTKNEYQTDPVDSNWDAFVAKIDTTQSGTASLIYSTYLGGSLDDYGRGIAVEAGCAYITGDTPSANFPASTQAQIASPQDAPPTSGRDVFVVRLNAAGDGITYSYRLRGDGDDYGRGIAVESGYAYVTGDTDSTNFRTEHQYQTDQVGIDAFVAKLDTSLSGGSSVIYSTYLGGNGSDEGRGIAVDSNGCAYVTGDTFSTDFPTVSPYQAERNGFYFDAFVAKLDTSQTGEGSLIYSTYLGGDSADHGRGIDVESGCAYVAGDTGSADFPTKNEYRADQGNWDAFVTKIDTNQIGDNSLIYSTYLGGSGDDAGYGIAVESGCACVTGDTLSTDFPTVNEYQGDRNGMDAFVSKLDTNQTGDNSLICSSYLGGSYDDHGRGIAAESGCAYVTGDTSSTDFPNLNQYQTDQGGWDAFVAKFGATAPWVVGGYSTKCSIKFYDWRCNKWIIVKGGTLYITSQVENKVEGYWQPDVAIERWKTLIPVDGYVGPIHRDAKGKIKNTPRLSLLLQAGEYCMYGTGPNASYVTYILNAKIKMDKKTEKVKSIKGAINGWGEYGTPFADIGGPSQGQFEGKFTATPVPAGPPAAGEGGAEYVEYAPSASEMPQPGAPADALSMIPNVLGDYPIKGSIKFYDWKCNKSIVVQSGILHVTWQADNKIEGYWQPIPAIDGWPALSPEFVGYVGPFYRDDKGKIKNTPRLSLLWEGGTYCAYPDEPYVTYILNAKVKVDRKTEPPLVKSIKGSINGWGEWGAPFSDNTSSLGQFEGKFTATPPLVP